jgi:hypothetical protein
MVFILFAVKIVYDIRVKSDFILFEGFLHSLRSFQNLPFSQNKILLLTLISLITISHTFNLLNFSQVLIIFTLHYITLII